MACVRECPGSCISATKSVKVNLAGHQVEWGEIDIDRCGYVFTGAEKTSEGEKGGYNGEGYKPNFISPFYQKPCNLYNTGQAVCGARGCTRACMISLESRGKLKNKFENPFCDHKPWTMDWSDEAIAADQPAEYSNPTGRPVKPSDVD